MKLRILLPYTLISLSIIVIMISFFSSRKVYNYAYEENIDKIRHVYILSICKETKFRIEKNEIPYRILDVPNIVPQDSVTITRNNVKYKVKKTNDYNSLSKQDQAFLRTFQSYLFYEKIVMDIVAVDSLVALDLKNKNLEVELGCKYIDNVNKTSRCSRKDSTFYTISQKLQPIVLGNEQEITIEPYIILSPKDILFTSTNNPFIPYFISCLLALVILVFSGVWIIWGRELAKMPVFAPLMGIRPEDIAPVEVVPNERPLQQKYLITKTIYLDVEREKVMEFDGRSVKLSKQMTDLMREFIHAHDRYLTYKEICVSLWGEVDINYSDRLSQLIKRLRKKLSLFPELSIDNKSGNGYQLLVHAVNEPPQDGPTAPEPVQKGDE